MKIKRNEYLQVVGLLALASTHAKALRDIEEAICKIVGETPGGHVGDAIYSNPTYTADELLKKVAARKRTLLSPRGRSDRQAQ